MANSATRVTGDFAELKKLVSGARKLADKSRLTDLNKMLGAAALTRVGMEFEQSQDPYGNTWKPARRGGQTLRDTGRLGNSFHFWSSTDTFELNTNVAYAKTHQYGATIKAKNKPFLVFKSPYATRVFNMKTGARLKRTRTLSNWIRVKQVTVPRRQMVPENDLGSIWLGDFEKEASAFIAEAMGG